MIDLGMIDPGQVIGLSRRRLLMAATACASATLVAPPAASAGDDDDAARLVEQLTGTKPAESDRVHLVMPKTFPNGYTVPLSLHIESPMTQDEHVKTVRVLAPKNPLIEVATFHFTPQRSEPRVSTRVRLAEPQFVLAVAEMSDGALLMAKTWVDVATDGCK